VITRAVGTDPEVDVDAFTVDARAGDVFLLCSDGLTDMVDDAAILDAVAENAGDLDRVTKTLVAAANRGGGEDNITVVAFAIGEEVADELGDTATMATVAEPEPDAETRESAAPVPPPPVGSAARVRLVFAALVVLAVGTALLVWGLVR
jgi:protein phosphatase